MMKEVILPELGEGISKAVVACWHCKVGDKVKEGDDLVELVTDKASFNVPSTASGKIALIKYPEGQEAVVGSILAVIKQN